MSHLEKKSDTLQQAAALLHGGGLHPAAAHPAYYSCYQLMMHIWLHRMGKTAQELARQRNSHKALINGVTALIKQSEKGMYANESRNFSRKILKLKKLRTNADYADAKFGCAESERSIALSKALIATLKKHYTP
jgi:hypothetical protein